MKEKERLKEATEEKREKKEAKKEKREKKEAKKEKKEKKAHHAPKQHKTVAAPICPPLPLDSTMRPPPLPLSPPPPSPLPPLPSLPEDAAVDPPPRSISDQIIDFAMGVAAEEEVDTAPQEEKKRPVKVIDLQ